MDVRGKHGVVKYRNGCSDCSCDWLHVVTHMASNMQDNFVVLLSYIFDCYICLLFTPFPRVPFAVDPWLRVLDLSSFI